MFLGVSGTDMLSPQDYLKYLLIIILSSILVSVDYCILFNMVVVTTTTIAIYYKLLSSFNYPQYSGSWFWVFSWIFQEEFKWQMMS